MPNTLPFHRHNQLGFTLIEILVVLVVVGILASVIVINFSDSSHQRELQREAQRLHAVLNIAADEAIFTATEYGFRYQRDIYIFFRYDYQRSEWIPIKEGTLRQHELPEGLQLIVEREGELVLPSREDQSQGEQPSLLFLSSGEKTAFEIKFKWEGGNFDATRDYRIYTDGLQDITLENP
ncbi:type II secretion system minor pseudopilin GspH [Desulfurispira natronophila]|uniref:Type II secretion system protein H n=1 Tax=Desulfurispira natronophila TaxID=682562 RepID=A0A7W7Y2J2_9BACT|nr:type II secretion system minor pseudopilin GspH [Desulfurispira natronophila]MBB5020893.1 general secretion pathway protein H [Desulfurispira natronophila]